MAGVGGGHASTDDITVYVIPLKYALAPPQKEDDDETLLGMPKIAAYALFGVLAVGLIAVIIFCCRRRQSNSQNILISDLEMVSVV